MELLTEKYNIDVSMMKRDYIKNPLYKSKNGVGNEIPHKEDIIYLYHILNMSQKDISIYFNVKPGTITRWLHHHNIGSKDSSLSLKHQLKTKLERYGVETYNNIDKIRKTKLERYGNERYNNIDKTKQTNLERYGNICSLHGYEVSNKTKQTNLERYGVENYSQTSEYHDKVKQTNLERYGEEYYSKTDECKEKIKQTNLERYGNVCPLLNDNIIQKTKQTNLERYGEEYYSQINIDKKVLEILHDADKMYEYISSSDIKTYNNLSSNLNVDVNTFRLKVIKYGFEHLIDFNTNKSSYEIDLLSLYPSFKTHNRKLLDGKEIDLYDDIHKLGIEFNGNFWHNEFGKNKNYHQEKSLLAEEKGIFLYHIFEYEWETKKDKIINQLNNLLGLNENKIYARKCIIKEVDNETKKEFLELNHMQGDDISSVRLGLYYDNELVSLMTFVKPRFNKKYEWELSRFCSKAGCNVIGGASKLFKYFIKTYNPKSIISYSNIAHTKGNLYGNLGFELKEITKPNYVWFKNNNILSRYQCQKHKLLEQGFDGISEVDIMHNRGYYRIYDCGNKVWGWNNN